MRLHSVGENNKFSGSLAPLRRRISGLVVEYIVAIDVTWVRFPADAALPAPAARCAVRLRWPSLGRQRPFLQPI